MGGVDKQDSGKLDLAWLRKTSVPAQILSEGYNYIVNNKNPTILLLIRRLLRRPSNKAI